MTIKTIKCPLCGENMIPQSWRSRPLILETANGNKIIPGIVEYSYICSCEDDVELKFNRWEK